MKIRNGFVSNSSSSSFVVAFPHKPESAEDVHQIMFNGINDSISAYDDDDDELTCLEIAQRVFSCLQETDFLEAKDEEIIEEFSGRYYYSHNAYQPEWCCELSRYCGSDSAAMEEIRQRTIKYEEKEKEINGKLWDVRRKYNMDKMPADLDRNAWYEKWKEFAETNDEYKKIRNEEISLCRSHHNSEDRESPETRVAKADLNNFKNDNKGAYIFIVEYSDNDGNANVTMEHGDIFRNVPHIRISHH